MKYSGLDKIVFPAIIVMEILMLILIVIASEQDRKYKLLERRVEYLERHVANIQNDNTRIDCRLVETEDIVFQAHPDMIAND